MNSDLAGRGEMAPIGPHGTVFVGPGLRRDDYFYSLALGDAR